MHKYSFQTTQTSFRHLFVGRTQQAAQQDRYDATVYQSFQMRFHSLRNGANDLSEQYDVIISADCLFFDEGRPQLLECLKKALKPGGTAIIVAPSRSGTFEVIVCSFLYNDS